MAKIAQRLSNIFLILLFCFSLLFMRLFQLQIINSDYLKQQALQSQHRYINAEEIPRGDIVDQFGRSLLNNELEQQEILVSSDNIIFENVDKKDLNNILPVAKRYGEKSLARHLVGHLSGDTGVKGLEHFYDDYLKSSPKYLWKITVDGKNNIVPNLSFQIEEREVARNKLFLTIDRDIQEIVETVMEEHSMSGSVVVMSPSTGDLLAVVSRPNFNQNNTILTSETSFINKAFAHYYPGSIFKILIGAAAMEEGLTQPFEKFTCSGSYILPSGLSINCWNTAGHGDLNFSEAMSYSCNPVFIELGLRLGKQNIIKYSHKLELTKNIISGYPQNQTNKIQIDDGPGKLANASLGQEGILLTPVQMAVLLSSFANGGYAVIPRVVKEVQDENGNILETISQQPPYRVWSDQTVSHIKEMLYAVPNWGTGENAWSDKVSSAGKTGSAETGHGINALYAGYFPADKPQYTVIVLVEEGISGGQSAAPIFKEIMENIS